MGHDSCSLRRELAQEPPARPIATLLRGPDESASEDGAPPACALRGRRRCPSALPADRRIPTAAGRNAIGAPDETKLLFRPTSCCRERSRSQGSGSARAQARIGAAYFPTVASPVPLHKDGTQRNDRQPVPAAAASRCGTPAARRRTADATDSRRVARADSAPRPSARCARVWLRPPCPALAPTTKAPACRDVVERRRGAP